jgi:hypothetical protein
MTMEMPHPTEAHRKLHLLAGTWRGDETLAPSPWDPAGGKARGRVENRESLDGFAVIQDYAQERNGRVTFRGHGIFGYDASRKRYTLHWFDNVGMGVSVFDGTFEGNILTLVATSPQGQTRAVWDFSTPGSYRNRMEVSGDGRSWNPFMEGTYTRE